MSPEETTAALQTALSAEHAAIYGYGLLGARLRGTPHQTARAYWDVHRTMRDRLRDLIIARQAEPIAAAVAYQLPVQVTSQSTAARLAAALEEKTMIAYLGVVASDDAKVRRFAATAMQETMTRATRWRGSAPQSAFPGMARSALSPLPE